MLAPGLPEPVSPPGAPMAVAVPLAVVFGGATDVLLDFGILPAAQWDVAGQA